MSRVRLWLFAAGYFGAYVPYALATRALADGTLGVARPVDGLALVPVTTAVSAVGMLAFFAATGLWRRARRVEVGGALVPWPRGVTWLSGACTAVIVLTTTLSYTVAGAGIVTMMLLMRGGVLVLAPLVDLASRRSVRRTAWLALLLSLTAVVIAIGTDGAGVLPAPALGIVALYLLGYFGRLTLMSRHGKLDERAGTAFFVEEQLVATPLALVGLGALALAGPDFVRTAFDATPTVLAGAALPWALLVGLASQATGIFGALVLVDPREHAYTVPVNRAASVLAGVVATALAASLGIGAGPASGELAGAALFLVAVVVLALGDRAPASSHAGPGASGA